MNQDEARWLTNPHTRWGVHHTKLSAELRLEKRVEELEEALREIADHNDPETLLTTEAKAVSKWCRARAWLALSSEEIAQEEE